MKNFTIKYLLDVNGWLAQLEHRANKIFAWVGII